MSGSDSDSDCADQLQYKVLVVGDGAIGKTSLIMRFCDGGFKESYRQTVGLDFFNKKINLPGQVTTTLQIWDIGGQQLGGKMLGNYLYGSHAILLVYDVTSLESFKNISHWLGFVRDTFKDKKEPPLLAVVGNKCDLNHLRAVKAEKHGSFAAEAQALSFFVSAKTGDRVNAMFTKIAADLSGVQLTKAEMDLAEHAIAAPIVDHPKAHSSEDLIPDGEKGKDKKDCAVM